MRRFIMYTLAILALGLTCQSRSLGQESKKPRGNWEKVSFWTADGVKLQGYFYPGPKGGKSPTVMLIHDVGGSPLRGGWPDLAADLQSKQNAAVLLFAFRGHGLSTEVKEEFWECEHNRLAAKGKVSIRNPPETIDVADFQRGYHRMLVNDLAAARCFLEQRNDGHECNSRQLILIGEGEGAAVGNAWLGLESRRFRLANPFAGIRDKVPESGDVLAAVWLNPRSTLGGKPVAATEWLRTANGPKPIRLGAIYDPDDSLAAGCVRGYEAVHAGKRNAKSMCAVLKVSADDAPDGRLIASESVREKARNYVFHRMGDDLPGWEEKEFDEHRYVWLSRSGVVVAKLEGERSMRVIPPDWVDRP